MVFNEVYDDLEREGYEVQSFLIPAASVNAPHQRQRIWFVAYCNNEKRFRQNNNNREWNIEKQKSYDRNKLRNNIGSIIESGNVANSKCIRLQHSSKTRQISGEETNAKRKGSESTLSFKTNDNGYKSKWENFPTKSPVCGGDDGLPRELDNITFPKWRKESIKAYGNAIVPQVAYEIFKAIQSFDDLVNV
jgi:DNA (cytosine-5)-methyltransferase 1